MEVDVDPSPEPKPESHQKPDIRTYPSLCATTPPQPDLPPPQHDGGPKSWPGREAVKAAQVRTSRVVPIWGNVKALGREFSERWGIHGSHLPLSSMEEEERNPNDENKRFEDDTAMDDPDPDLPVDARIEPVNTPFEHEYGGDPAFVSEYAAEILEYLGQLQVCLLSSA
jgi:hypothetical protein